MVLRSMLLTIGLRIPTNESSYLRNTSVRLVSISGKAHPSDAPFLLPDLIVSYLLDFSSNLWHGTTRKLGKQAWNQPGEIR